ncbi:Hypothetical protein FKW44_020490, partial [Caligus rogercresseyi]
MNSFRLVRTHVRRWRRKHPTPNGCRTHTAKGNVRIKLAYTNVDEDPYVLRSGMELCTINAITQSTPTNPIAAMNNAVNVNPPDWEIELVDPN